MLTSKFWAHPEMLKEQTVPQAVNKAEKGSQSWTANEVFLEVRESLQIEASISSQFSSHITWSSLLLLCDVHFLGISSPTESELFLPSIEQMPEWIRGNASPKVSKPKDSLNMAGVSNIPVREEAVPQLYFRLWAISHFCNTDDKCGTGILSVWTPMIHVPDFLGEGLSSNNSKESTSWKYAISLSYFGSCAFFPCKKKKKKKEGGKKWTYENLSLDSICQTTLYFLKDPHTWPNEILKFNPEIEVHRALLMKLVMALRKLTEFIEDILWGEVVSYSSCFSFVEIEDLHMQPQQC